MRTLRGGSASFLAILAVVVVALFSIDRSAPEPVRERPETQTIELADHEIQFEIPKGWQYDKEADGHRFRRGINEIKLLDLGPATAAGLVAVLRASQARFEDHDWEASRALLDPVDPAGFFAGHEDWKSIEEAWRRVRWIERDEEAGTSGSIDSDVEWAVQSAFHDLIAVADSLGDADLDTIVRPRFEAQSLSALRDLAEERSLSVSGLPAIRMDTWDRLSHEGRRAELFVLLGGRLLCLQMGLGQFDVQDPAFEALTQSLRFESVDSLL